MNLIKREFLSHDQYTGCFCMTFDDYFTQDVVECYKNAIDQIGSYVSLDGMGGPTIDKVHFNGKRAYTNTFPISIAMNQQRFFAEFDRVIAKTNELLEQKKKFELEEMEKAAKEREEIAAKVKDINDSIKL